ncbi:MAG: SUMF1/EgtB/PvdO family nonheme iron enzyme [bacterium]
MVPLSRLIIGVVVCAGLIALFLFFARRRNAAVFLRFRAPRRLRTVSGDFTPSEIRHATGKYLWPECQNIDPAAGDHRAVVRGSLKDTLDRIFTREANHRHIMLVAGAGMGKTSFLIHYCLHCMAGSKGALPVSLISLGIAGFPDRLKRIPSPEKTLLLLDGLDEDAEMMQEPVRRLFAITEATKRFRGVVLTCDMHHFKRIEKIAADTMSTFSPLYLSPLSDQQIRLLLRTRLPFWQKGRRRRAESIVRRFPRAMACPLALSNIRSLTDPGVNLKRPSQIYASILNTWMEEEQKSLGQKGNLRSFAGALAVKVFTDPAARIHGRIPSNEVEPLAKRFGIDPATWRLSDRSLIQRDVQGDYRFAYRFFLDFLFARQIAANNSEAAKVPMNAWTGDTKAFIVDALERRPWRYPLFFVSFGEGIIDRDESGQAIPMHPFDMCIYPVTNREYEEFDPAHRVLRNEYSDKDDQPVVNVTWEDAQGYCRWLTDKTGDTYRLPTEAEWEFAARGGGKRAYPWGNEGPTIERVNFIDTKIMKTTAVVSFPLGMTPEGLYNMAGNTWEWCDDWYNRKENFRVIRGGSFFDLGHFLRCDFRLGADANERTNYIGFRVVKEIRNQA